MTRASCCWPRERTTMSDEKNKNLMMHPVLGPIIGFAMLAAMFGGCGACWVALGRSDDAAKQQREERARCRETREGAQRAVRVEVDAWSIQNCRCDADAGCEWRER